MFQDCWDKCYWLKEDYIKTNIGTLSAVTPEMGQESSIGINPRVCWTKRQWCVSLPSGWNFRGCYISAWTELCCDCRFRLDGTIVVTTVPSGQNPGHSLMKKLVRLPNILLFAYCWQRQQVVQVGYQSDELRICYV